MAPYRLTCPSPQRKRLSANLSILLASLDLHILYLSTSFPNRRIADDYKRSVVLAGALEVHENGHST